MEAPHPLHEYIAGQIGDQIRNRHLVVIYDRNEELRPFFQELDGEPAGEGLELVWIGNWNAKLCVFDGSFLKVRAAVEPVTNGNSPDNVVIYLPGIGRDDRGSLLMELEKAGTCYRPPALRQIARYVLRRRFTDVAIDEMLHANALGYTDYARMSINDDGSSNGPSILKGIFGVTDSEAILTAWIADADHDTEIDRKGAIGELRAVIRAVSGSTCRMPLWRVSGRLPPVTS